jgi:hypothetical protein
MYDPYLHQLLSRRLHHWSDKAHQPFKLHPLVDYESLSGSLSKSECLDILERRHVLDQLPDDKGHDDNLEALQIRVRDSTPENAKGNFWGGKWYVIFNCFFLHRAC